MRTFLYLTFAAIGFSVLGCGGSEVDPPQEVVKTTANTDEGIPVSTPPIEPAKEPEVPPVALPEEPEETPQRVTALRPVLHYPAYVTAYDIQTPEDEFYYHHLKYLCEGSDFSEWPIIKALVDLGQNLVDAPLWASIATETIYITDQPRAKPIIDVVEECAKILDIEPPPVHIDGDATPNAYVAGLKAPHVLVFTSGLLDLYEESPEELRFVIGHELGHIKAGHIRTHFVGRKFVGSMLGDEGAKASFADDFLAAISIHTLLHWFRESEYSADRAGLLCIGGDVRVAKQALLRLLHQTKPSNKLFDPSHPEFDAELVIARQMRIREQPFVKVLAYIRQFRQSHPFIPERCAALESWSLSSEYLTIQERQAQPKASKEISITHVEVSNIPKVDTYVPFVDSGETDPFIKITYAGKSNATKHAVDRTSVKWPSLSVTNPYQEGANVIIELFDYNGVLSNAFIGSCLVPVYDTSAGDHEVEMDLRLDIEQRSTVVDLPKVKVKYRIADNSSK